MDSTWSSNPAYINSSPARVVPALRVASWNVSGLGQLFQNGAPVDVRYPGIAKTIVHRLQAPHIIALQEMSVAMAGRDGRPVSADQTAKILIDAIKTAGGPEYRYCECAPIKNSNGGPHDTNIRCGFLYRPDRVELAAPIANPKAGTTPAHSLPAAYVMKSPAGLRMLNHNPALIAPNADIFEGARKPLVAQFIDRMTGETFFITNVHLSAHYRKVHETADALKHLEARRLQQANVTLDFQTKLDRLISQLGERPTTHRIVLGDFNMPHTHHSNQEPALDAVGIFEQHGMTLVSAPLQHNHIRRFGESLPPIDHVLVSATLQDRVVGLDEPSIQSHKPSLTDHNPIQLHIAPARIQEISPLSR